MHYFSYEKGVLQQYLVTTPQFLVATIRYLYVYYMNFESQINI